MIASIPSPPPSWQFFEFDLFGLLPWLRSLGWDWVPVSLQIHMYAVCILTGIILACLVTAYRFRQRGIPGGFVIDVALWAVVLGIIGARAFHVISHPNDFFGPGTDPMRVFRIWEGGIAIFGALIGGAVGVWIGARTVGLRFWAVADAAAPGILIAQALGRFGNWFNHELFGAPTGLPWGLEIEATNPAFPVGLGPNTLFHPTFLYEVIWNLLGAALILMVDRKRTLQWGRAVSMYLIWYGLGRMAWETMRLDPSEAFFGIRTNVWMAIFSVVLGALLWWSQSMAHPEPEPSPWLPGRSPEELEAAQLAADEEDTLADEDSDADDERQDVGERSPGAVVDNAAVPPAVSIEYVSYGTDSDAEAEEDLQGADAEPQAEVSAADAVEVTELERDALVDEDTAEPELPLTETEQPRPRDAE